MSQAEELLNGMSEEVPAHTHPVPDTDTYFVIDPVTRKIENTNPKKHVIMQYDHNSERCTFELPRFIDGHDMLECTSVTVNVDNIEVVESEGVEEAEPVEPRINSDAPDMTDLQIHPNDPEKVISSWLISRNSTQLAGILSFHIEYKCVDSNGNVVYEWSTDNYDEYEIRARKKNGEAAIAPHIDTLEQWRTRIFGAGDSVMANIAAEGEVQVAAVKAESETQQEAVELKGVQTLDSIPEDYTEVDAMAEEAVRSKGDAIVCEAAGESIVLKDSSNDHIRGLKLFGKSKQDGIPTPDNPVEIISTPAPTVSICGKNLADFACFSGSNNYVALVNVSDLRSVKKGQRYTLSVYLHATAATRAYWNNAARLYAYLEFDVAAGTNRYTYSFTALEDGELYEAVSNVVNKCPTSDDVVVTALNVQLEFGDKVTEYEPYEGGLLSITTPSTLPGIPVTSGGNYTDENGQQWICDEIDLERGVYVQRIKIDTVTISSQGILDNGLKAGIYKARDKVPQLSVGAICDRAKYVGMSGSAKKPNCVYENVNTFGFTGTETDTLEALQAAYDGATIAYILATPIETPLTAEEITAFKALRTNHPNTTILNDAGAWMSVKYNADTKSYVDKPKTLRLTDTSTGVVYELKVVDGNLTVVPV